MNSQTALFMLNIPAALLTYNRTDAYVACKAERTSTGSIHITFLDVDSHLMVSVKVPWMQVYMLAKEVAESHLPPVEQLDNFSIMDLACQAGEKVRVTIHDQVA